MAFAWPVRILLRMQRQLASVHAIPCDLAAEDGFFGISAQYKLDGSSKEGLGERDA